VNKTKRSKFFIIFTFRPFSLVLKRKKWNCAILSGFFPSKGDNKASPIHPLHDLIKKKETQSLRKLEN
jgi:hypothetical protein